MRNLIFNELVEATLAVLLASLLLDHLGLHDNPVLLSSLALFLSEIVAVLLLGARLRI